MGSSQSSHAADHHQQPSSSTSKAAGIKRVGGRKSNKNSNAAAASVATKKIPGGAASGKASTTTKSLLGLGGGAGKKEQQASVVVKEGAAGAVAVVDVVPDKTKVATTLPGLVGSFVSETTTAGPSTAFFVVDSRDLSEEVVDLDSEEIVVATMATIHKEKDEQPVLHHHLEGVVEVEESEDEEGAVLVPSDVSSTDEEDSDDDDEEDDDEDELWEERLRILEEAKSLKAVATWFLRPELKTLSSSLACASNYFDRASMQEPVPSSDDEEEVKDDVLGDVMALKASARAYLHPEDAVVASPSACARSYFTRASAPEYETDEAAEERDLVWEDLQALKASAVQFLHPELPLQSSPSACARNYYTRASAPEYEDDEVDLERDYALQDVKALKAAATQYLHPELPVTVSPVACARNYCTRPSAPEYDDDEDAMERNLALQDAKMLKASAAQYMHPERAVKSSPSACARNYFSRATATEYEDDETDLERDYLMEDVAALKAAAVQYLHPELPITSSPSACARNYFTRASAPEHEQEDQERDNALDDAKMLKAAAVQYLHPEIPVTASPSACARNYFIRASAPEYEEDEEDLERDYAMEDVKALKAAAAQFLHPELPVTSSPSMCARNYFSRASAPEYEEDEVDLERDFVKEDVKALKAAAAQFLHPELPVTSSPSACSRSYLTRASAPEYEEDEVDLQRDYAMEDAKALKAAAAQYLHPELPVESSPSACARNYFTRPSAPEYEEDEEDLERDYAMEDVKALKASAVQYLHPEAAVSSSIAVTRASPFVSGGAMDERAAILEEMKQLKTLATQYLHPEKPVIVSPVATARCYFSRPTADAYESPDDVAARAEVLNDVKSLKAQVAQYRTPDAPVVVDPEVTGRNYFGRASAASVEDDSDDSEERKQVLADAAALKKHAVDFLHPELGMAGRSVAGGRSYFDRPSARGHDHMVHTFPAHEDDLHHDDHHHDEHMDHFGMDEEMEARFDDLRNHLPMGLKSKAAISGMAQGSAGSDEEGKLSRSPSSVMLFTEESIYD